MPRKRARTPYGQGSVYQRADGVWVAVARVEGQPPKRLYASSEDDVKERRDDYLARHRLGLASLETKLTVGRHLDGWLTSKRRTVRPSTWVGYELHVRHLRPLWGIRLAKLTPNDVRRHVAALHDGGFSEASIAHNLTVLRMALGQAVADGLVTRNVASLVEKPRIARAELDIWQPLDVRRFLALSEPCAGTALFRLLIGSGLRLGEALALRDPDIVGGSLSVSGSLRPIDARLRKSGPRLVRVEPKTSTGWRTIAMTDTAAQAIRDAQASRRGRNVAGYIFTTPRGTPLDPRNVSRFWDAYQDAYGLRRIRIHDLRHSFASLMLASGATIYDVSRYLGHSSITITADLYGHLVEGRSAEVAAGFARVIGG